MSQICHLRNPKSQSSSRSRLIFTSSSQNVQLRPVPAPQLCHWVGGGAPSQETDGATPNLLIQVFFVCRADKNIPTNKGEVAAQLTSEGVIKVRNIIIYSCLLTD